MKKFVKSAVSVILALTVCLSMFVFAYAAEDTKNINGTEYIYYGKMPSDGRTEIECETYEGIFDLNVYYSFNAPENGYYRISYGTPHTSAYACLYERTDIYGETYYSDIYCETSYPDYYSVQDIYYLNQGEYIFTAEITDSAVKVDFNSEYLGERITDYSFAYDQILEADFSCSSGQFNSSAQATITFSSGEVIEFNGNTHGFLKGSELVEGENDVSVEFCGDLIEITATVYPASYYIKDAQLSNAEYYLEQSVINNDFVYPYGETVTVTLTDGTMQTAVLKQGEDYITLPNGQDYAVYVGCSVYRYNASADFTIYIDGGVAIGETYYFSENNFSVSEGFSEFVQRMEEAFEESVKLFEYAFESFNFEYIVFGLINLMSIPVDFFSMLFMVLI